MIAGDLSAVSVVGLFRSLVVLGRWGCFVDGGVRYRIHGTHRKKDESQTDSRCTITNVRQL